MSKRKINFINVLEDYFETYLPHSRGLSPNTIKSYKHCFLLLLQFMREQKNKRIENIQFADLSYDTLLEFLNWLETERSCTAVTRNQRLSALSAFSEYAQDRDFDAASIFRSAVARIPVKKYTRRMRAAFSKEEVQILLSLPSEKSDTGLRDKILLSFMYATGARAQEICDLRVKDFCFSDKSAAVTLFGKGSKSRQIGVTPNLAKTLSHYIKYRHIENLPDRHIFSSQTHEHMTVSCVEGIYKKYVTLAKKQHPCLFQEKSYPPHSMRHSTACHLLEAGVDIVTIKNILGHVSLQTTQIYAEMSQDTVDQKLKEWNETWFGKREAVTQSNKSEDYPAFLKCK